MSPNVFFINYLLFGIGKRNGGLNQDPIFSMKYLIRIYQSPVTVPETVTKSNTAARHLLPGEFYIIY